MKEKLTIVLCTILIFLTGCGATEPVGSSEVLPVLDEPESIEGLVTETEVECASRNEKERFLEPRGTFFHDGWIFYNGSKEIRKCKPDLTEDTLVFSGGRLQSLNQDGIATMTVYPGESRKPGEEEVHILNVHSGIAEKIDTLDTEKMSHQMLYKEHLIVVQGIVIEGHGAASQLDMYDIKGDFIKTIAPNVNSSYFAAIDNYIYYLPMCGDEEMTIPANTIMRYDIVNDKTEEVLMFDLKIFYESPDETIYVWPGVLFNGRTITIRVGLDNFIYTSVDEIDPKEIVFDGIGRDDFFELIPSFDDDIFLMQQQHDEEKPIDESFLFSAFFRIDKDKNEAVLLQKSDMRSGVFFYDGFRYYMETNESTRLKREKFY